MDTYDCDFYPDLISRDESEIRRKMLIIKDEKRCFVWSEK